ncbi:hypothetical protein LCGC14_1097840 [marine sediment metagenome]|uniref:Uncharacterized protein n=1 Tax=marine sediment metagenome TaxID=412755 RepID=A0A0F9PTL6_9ZZZZ|nr:hypothetical protein [Candidatus Aminicenantes bacterium]
MNDLYEMELHEVINYDNFEVCRVPGGWVYRFLEENYIHGTENLDTNKMILVDSVFVPLNDEMRSITNV